MRRDRQRPAHARRRPARRRAGDDRRRQRRHPAAAAAGLAGGAGGRELDARRRRLDPAPPGRPDRGAAARDGRRASAREDRLPPLRIRGAQLHGITYELPIASAQVKSCLLFAGLLAAGETRIVEPVPSRDHSERMLAAAGAEVGRERRASVTVRPAARLEPGRIVVPADISSAAFFVAAALLVPGSEVVLAAVGINPTRTGLLTILERMGAEIEVEPRGRAGRRAVGHLRVRAAALRGTEVGGAEVPLAIDELPLVALAACFAEGETTIRDAAELRRKESDRIATVTAALRALGAEVEPTPDGMVVTGSGGLHGGAIDSHGDHRIAMLGAVAGLASADGVEVEGIDAAAVSYPASRPTSPRTGLRAPCAPASGGPATSPRRGRGPAGPLRARQTWSAPSGPGARQLELGARMDAAAFPTARASAAARRWSGGTSRPRRRCSPSCSGMVRTWSGTPTAP